MKLHQSLYGPHQSQKNWWNTIDDYLADIGFKPLKFDPCVYIYTDNEVTAILNLYVDDVLLLAGNKAVLRKLKGKLMSRFAVTDMGWFSGCRVRTGRRARSP